MARPAVLRVLVLSDGTTKVVADFKEIGAASEATAAKIDKSSVASAGSMAEMEKGTHRLSGAVGMLAGTIGITGLAFGIKDVVDQGEQWQLQQAQLVNALKRTHDYSKSAMAAVEKSADSLSTHGGYAPAENLTAMNQFIRLTASSTEAIKLNQAATNLARGTTLGYGQAQLMIGQVLTGNAGRLQKYLGIIQPVKTAEFALTQAHGFTNAMLEAQSKAVGKVGAQWLAHEEVLHNITPAEMQHAQLLDKQATAMEVLQRIQARYGNSTAVFSRTTAGAISNLSHHFDLLGKTIGKTVLPLITSIVQFMSKHTTAIFALSAAVTALTIAWGINAALTTAIIGTWSIAGAVGAVFTGIVAAMSAGIQILNYSFELLGISATIGWAAATLGVTLLIAAIVLVATHFKQFKQIVSGVWDWLKGAVATVVRFVAQHWKVLAYVLGGPFIALGVFVATHFAQIKHLVADVVGFIGRIFSKVFHVIAWPFQEAWKIISAIFTWIKNGLAHLLGPIGSVLHTLGSVGSSIGGFVSHPFGLHNGGIIHAASGGLLGGYGGGDRVPALLEAGEGVLRKEAVSGIGNQAFNAINTSGSLPPSAALGQEYLVGVPVTVNIAGRAAAEAIVHTVARRAQLSSNYVSG